MLRPSNEASMLRPDLFEKIREVGSCFIRKKPHLPFGGMQLILCGDFAQCEPIYTREERESAPEKCTFLFESPLFQDMFPWQLEKVQKSSLSVNTILLERIFRQEDLTFQKVLSRIRLCRHTEDDLNLLETRMVLPPEGIKIRPTQLRATRKHVDKINMEELRTLEPDQDKWHVYHYSEKIYAIGYEKEARGKFLLDKHKEECQSPQILQLAPGAQVILTKNDANSGLVNGSRGIVVEFEEAHDGKKHDSSEQQKPALYPVVEFLNGMRQVIVPEAHSIEENGETLAEYIQIPLKLAWALTIHKSQGMSLDLIQVSLDETVKGSGQAYVCLSRVVDITGLYFIKFDASVILLIAKSFSIALH